MNKIDYDYFEFRPAKACCFQDEAIVFTFAQVDEAVRFYGHGDTSVLKYNFMMLPQTIFIGGGGV